MFKERLDLFEKNMKSNGRRILDIGSVPGFFLKFAKDLGWEVQGLELSDHAATYSESIGVPVDQLPLTNESLNRHDSYDVVYSNQALEHFNNSKEIFELCYALLKSNGLFFVSVANDFNSFQRILYENFNVDPWWFDPPEHINYFNCESLDKLFKGAGFEVLDSTSSFLIDIFLLMGEDYLRNSDLGKLCHERRKIFELSLMESGNKDLKDELYKSFSNLNVGRHVNIFRKEELIYD